MNRTRRALCGLALGLTVVLAARADASSTRLIWETQGATVSWHRNCAFQHAGPGSVEPSHRFVTLDANLRSMARGDAALYAVYLKDAGQIQGLKNVLTSVGAPVAWKHDGHEVAAVRKAGIDYEWLSLAANGAIAVHADEANHPGATLVAIVNADGEILGAHALWRPHQDLAGLVSP